MGGLFCKLGVFLVLRFEDKKKMTKYQYSQDTDQSFLLVKRLVDERKRVGFLKPPSMREQTGVYKDGGLQHRGVKNTLTHTCSLFRVTPEESSSTT